MRRQLAIAVTALTLATIVLCVSRMSSTPPLPDPSEYSFTSNQDGRTGIYLRSDGKTELLTKMFDVAEAPDWSRNGNRLAFQAKVDGNYDIYVLDFLTGLTSRLTFDTASDSHPVWSPDGSKIAFVSDRGNEALNFNIYVMNADGTKLHPLLPGLTEAQSPSWSPDGNFIAFSAPSIPGKRVFREGDVFRSEELFMDIYVARNDGAEIHKLTDDKAVSVHPTWSPDGAQIAFSSNREDDPKGLARMEIYVMDSDGGNIVRLTTLKEQSVCPKWTFHRNRILFHASVMRNPQEPWNCTGVLYSVTSDTGELSQLTRDQADQYFPAWRPTARP